MNKIIKANADKIISLNNKISTELLNTNSNFHKITIACLRWKQLNQGARPRIAENKLKRKNTSIAFEEVKQGLITFTTLTEQDLS